MFKKKTYRKYAMPVLAAVVMLITPIVATADAKVKFTDVNDKTVSPKSTQTAIYELVENYNAINGYQDGTFRPGKDINRAQVAKIITGALGLSLPQNLEWALRNYSDVGPNHEYAVFIAATTVTDVFHGDNGKFKPWTPITRGEMAIVLGRILKEYDTVGEDVDVNMDKVPDSAKEGVQIIANLGVTTELDDYRAKENVTRAQFAAFAFRTLTVIDESNY